MGPAGLPGPPGVKVSSLHYQNFSVQQVDFCLFVCLFIKLIKLFVFYRVIKEKQVLVYRYKKFYILYKMHYISPGPNNITMCTVVMYNR